VVFEVTGTTVMTPRPSRVAVALAASLLTTTAGLGGFGSPGGVEGDADDLATAHSAVHAVGQSSVPGCGVIGGRPGGPGVLVGDGELGGAQQSVDASSRITSIARLVPQRYDP
jgi:hypothetical protein